MSEMYKPHKSSVYFNSYLTFYKYALSNMESKYRNLWNIKQKEQRGYLRGS